MVCVLKTYHFFLTWLHQSFFYVQSIAVWQSIDEAQGNIMDEVKKNTKDSVNDKNVLKEKVKGSRNYIVANMRSYG